MYVRWRMMPEQYEITELELSDISRYIEFSSQYNNALGDGRYIIWKYLNNPYGKPRIFVVIDNGKIKGALSFIPRLFITINSTPILGMQALDAFIAPEDRGKSLYPKLFNHSMNKISEPIYAFPNNISEIVERRCGWSLISAISTWRYPITLCEFPFVSRFRFVRSIVNSISKVYSNVYLKDEHVKINETTEINFKLIGWPFLGRTYGSREPEYLKWRFIDNPKKYHYFEFIDNNEVIGYCVFARKGASVSMYDFNVTKKIKGAMRSVVERFRSENVSHIVFNSVNINLMRLGFIKGRKTIANLLGYNFPQDDIVITYCDSDIDSDWDY